MVATNPRIEQVATLQPLPAAPICMLFRSYNLNPVIDARPRW